MNYKELNDIIQRYTGVIINEHVLYMIKNDIISFWKECEHHGTKLAMDSYDIVDPSDICVWVNENIIMINHKKYLELEGIKQGSYAVTREVVENRVPII